MMNFNNQFPPQNMYPDPITSLDNYFRVIMNAVSTQNLQKCEENLRFATSVYKSIENGLNPEANIFLCNYVKLMEAATRFLDANLLLDDERLNKSLAELNVVKSICDEAAQKFALLTPAAESLLNQQGGVSLLRFMLAYFGNMTVAFRGVVQKSLEMREGKFVNQIEMFRQAADELRKEDYYRYFSHNQEFNGIISELVTQLNAKADSFERKAERLEENRKDIEFMPPIDRRVFIVHGHDETALDELKDLLATQFNIKPIILWKEQDDGETVIEKFERYGQISAFAFVLATPDDSITKNEATYFQARPNVLFELGWFCGRYGRDKVRILKQKNTQMPSDLNGLITLDFDEKISEITDRIKNDLMNAGVLE